MILLMILKQLLNEEKNKKNFRKGVYKKVIFGYIIIYTKNKQKGKKIMKRDISEDIMLFTEFLKTTFPLIFKEDNIKEMLNEFEIWRMNYFKKEFIKRLKAYHEKEEKEEKINKNFRKGVYNNINDVTITI